MKKKEVPKPVFRWIALVGVMLGLLIGGAVFILLPDTVEMWGWFVCLVMSLGGMYITDFKNRDLMDAWGITEKRKKKQ